MTGPDDTQETDSAAAQGVAGVPVSGLATAPKDPEPVDVVDMVVIGPDPVWPDWTLIELTCSGCDAKNQVHEPTQADLDQVHPVSGNRTGIVWECNACSAKNTFGAEAPSKPDLYVLECGNCHSTFAPSQTAVAPDGTWVCRVCDTENRDVHSHDTGSGTSSASTVPEG